ncbi:MAG: hypothetical protein EAZ27_02065 [Cytophagales bacterium]|nr:MAG: hypothetical protein EAZ27_02065 [Cytophagales bacterium]
MNIQRHNLTQPQIEFVKFLGNRNISDQEIGDIKRLISHYYIIKADLLMDNIWQEKGISEQKMIEILNAVL